MSSTEASRQLVYRHGLLTNGNETSLCTVQSWEVTYFEGRSPDYTRHRIIDVSKRLPDGLYELETEGERFKVRRAMGLWSVVDPDLRA